MGIRSREEALIEYLECYGFQNIKKHIGRNGTNIMASCPFAAETHRSGRDSNPSWGILVETGQYGCFSCHKKGNLFTLANELGIPLFDLDSAAVLSLDKSFERLRDKLRPEERGGPQIMNLPEDFHFFDFEQAIPPLTWLREKGYSDETIRAFGIGYGGCGPLFPITDDNSYIVGWQMRNITSSGPKYQNSLSPKSELLYNYARAREAEECVVVEAFLSVLTLHELGIASVSTGGAHLSAPQAGKLGVFSSVTLCYDNDMAGIIGLNKAAELLSGAPFTLYWVAPPKNTKIHRMSREQIVPLLQARKHVNL